MRLLKCLSGGAFELTSFDDEHTPPYAILSHTWMQGQEVTYSEILAGVGTGTRKSGYNKLYFCAERAEVDGLEYFWVDTCCIDKATSDELSTAINSMFRWYQRASKCYVYLTDVCIPEEISNAEAYRISWEQAFRRSRWFTRGWTLQELLAPANVEFFSREGKRLGSRISLESEIHEITGISVDVLRGQKLNQISVEERMSWMTGRTTTLKEDRVYCLLGIFGVYLPLIYGEGEENATLRLKEEILKRQQGHITMGLQDMPGVILGKNISDECSEVLSVVPRADMFTKGQVGEEMKSTGSQFSTYISKWLTYTDSGVESSMSSSPPKHDSVKRHRYDILHSTTSGVLSRELFRNDREAAHTCTAGARLQSIPILNYEQKHHFLESLRFEQIDARQLTIDIAHARTCEWLPMHTQYLEWLDETKLHEHHGFLWVKGKAGAGKSTLMKKTMIHVRDTMKDCTTIAFFFNARGEDLEKSTVGTYRSLLLQLLERFPMLLDSLEIPVSILTKNYHWAINPLKSLLEQAIKALRKGLVICFVDALDECEEDQVRDMIQFFYRIGDLAIKYGIRFQVCLSSRHYPHITIRNGLELFLDTQEGHTQDIAEYIGTELRIGKSKMAQQIRVELQEKASGIFMWVVLVVGILNKEFDRGQISTLRRKLHEIPGSLHELFRDILTRGSNGQGNPDDKDKLVLCIQWVLFAREPLSPEQLYHAIYSGLTPEMISASDFGDMTKHDIKRFIIHASKGLVEATESTQSKIQFIHESVKDFLLNENGLGKVWPEYARNFDGQSHDRLSQCCLNYINMDTATPLIVPEDLPEALSQDAVDLRERTIKMFPLLEYAVQSVLYHADFAHGTGISREGFLNDFVLSPWIKLHNMFTVYQTKRYTKGVSLLYILAEHNAANLIRILPTVDSCLDIADERYGCALFAANVTESHHAMQVFIEHLEKSQNTSAGGEQLREGRSVRTSAMESLGPFFRYSESKDVISCAVTIGNATVLACLIARGWLELDRRNESYETPLYTAVKHGKADIVRVLLDNGADVNAMSIFSHPLRTASANGHVDIVAMLLDKGADINAHVPLQAASYEGHKDVVMLLLDKGADVNADDGFNTALMAASSQGHKDIVTVLLDKGADVNAKMHCGLFSNALEAASSSGHKDIVVMLLDKGADVNTHGILGNALYAASAAGHKDIATMLLDKGADVSNVLQAASSSGHKDIVVMLLDKGADVNALGIFGNALQAASAKGHKDIVTMLLSKGAEVNAKVNCGFFSSALEAASAEGHKDIVTVLLDKGASHYRDALVAALARGHKEVVKILQDKLESSQTT